MFVRLRTNTQSLSIKDSLFSKLLTVSGLFSLGIVSAILLTLLIESKLAIKQFGVSFFTSLEWNPVIEQYSAPIFVAGTLLTSSLAILISIPFTLALSVFLGEIVKKTLVSRLLNLTLDLLAGIPSVIYGFWGLIILVPIVRNLQLSLGVAPYGVGILTAALVLAIMIIPYAASMGRDVILLIPNDYKEAAFSVGATRYDYIKKIVLPYAKSGLFSGHIVAFGRAISETMAVTMLIGNANILPGSIFSPANTLASVIANDFPEASDELYLSSLILLAVVLFAMSLLFNLFGRWLTRRGLSK